MHTLYTWLPLIIYLYCDYTLLSLSTRSSNKKVSATHYHKNNTYDLRSVYSQLDIPPGYMAIRHSNKLKYFCLQQFTCALAFDSLFPAMAFNLDFWSTT
jgi:hypothetical protein